MLTTGVDTFNGGAGNDTFTAANVNPLTGTDAHTLTSSDSLDGGAGNDTLNIYSKATYTNNNLGTIKNIETVNIHNEGGAAAFGVVDASKFVGATQVWQLNNAAAVSKLAGTTAAGFKTLETAGLTVTTDATAASATVALDSVKKSTGTDNVVALNVSADAANTALAAVTVAGNVTQKDTAGVKEVFKATFTTGAGAATDTLTFDGITYTASGTLSAAATATAFTNYYNTQAGATWVAVDDGTGGVTFTKKMAGDVADVATAKFVVAGGGGGATVAVTAAAPIDQGADVAIASLALTVGLGKNVQAATVNTAVKSTLTIDNAAGSTKALTTVDASASTGGVTYTSAGVKVATIKTGVGADVVTLATALDTTTTAASVNTGAGNDKITVTAGAAAAVTGGTTVVVDAGEGNDTIDLTISANTAYDVKAGAGDDTVVIVSGAVKSTDKIDGGDGVDTISLAGKATYLADDYIVLNKVLTNFETLKLTGTAVTNLDASKLAASYTTLDLYAASVVDNVSTQALVGNGTLTAEAAGYKSATENLAAGGTSTILYAGTLNITDKGLAAASDAIQAHAEIVNLTVAGGKANNVTANYAVLTGEAKTVAVTLSAGTDMMGTAVPADDVLVASRVTVKQDASGSAAAESLSGLTSLTLSGNGAAIVEIGNVGTPTKGLHKLVLVDASGLNSVNELGQTVAGLTYKSVNTAAEVIKLGGGIDSITLGASTYGKMDTVEGLNLVIAAGATTAKSDTLVITGLANLGATGKFTTAQTDLDLALLDAAKFKVAGVDVNTVVFHLNGDTFIYQDGDGTIIADGLVSADDIVVKLTGLIDLDALVIAV